MVHNLSHNGFTRHQHVFSVTSHCNTLQFSLLPLPLLPEWNKACVKPRFFTIVLERNIKLIAFLKNVFVSVIAEVKRLNSACLV